MGTQNILKNLIAIAIVALQVSPLIIILISSYNVSSWTDNPGWLIDANTNCKYYTSHNVENRTVSWDGDCREGIADGSGKLVIYEGGLPLYQFDGTLSAGRMDGTGRLTFLFDGDVYEGQFADGEIQGLGHFYNDDGDHYEGLRSEGMRHGYGTYWYGPDDPIFKYAGDWNKGQRHGTGTMYFRNGDILKGVYQEDELASVIEGTESSPVTLPKNILITNDDGVEDMNRLICLAEELSTVADRVVVAVSKENKSGTSNRMSVTSTGFLQAKCLMRDTIRNISIYEVDGYPADCVILGAAGLFGASGEEVDLVISGINGGANSGADWFGSGTIGAARTAALAGIPAIAISGIDEDSNDPYDLQLLCKWVTNLTQSGIVDIMKPFDYLTISLPRELEKIKGTKIVERAITFDNAPFQLSRSNQTETKVGENEIWKIIPTSDPATVYNFKKPHDVAYYYQDYIVIVPMSVDENDRASLAKYQNIAASLPLIQTD